MSAGADVPGQHDMGVGQPPLDREYVRRRLGRSHGALAGRGVQLRHGDPQRAVQDVARAPRAPARLFPWRPRPAATRP